MSIDYSDQDLVSRVRHGDTSAFGDLYAHHSAAAHRAARRIARDPHLAEDIVSESFARVFKALQGGHGPTGDVFPYLLVTMRNVAASWGRESVKWTPVGDDTVFAPRDARDLEAAADELPVDRLNLALTSAAFGTLPRRWRTVLWYLEVEGESATQVGQRLGLSDVAVRQLARRAREGLREAYLAAYLGGTPAVGDHVPTADLVAMARGKLSLRRRAAVERHLDTCPKCSGLLLEAAEENSTLRALVLPLYLAVLFALVKWSQASGRRLPRIAGKHLLGYPAAQAAVASVSIVTVVSTALVVTPQTRGGEHDAQARSAQAARSGHRSAGGSATTMPISPSSSTSAPTAPTPTPSTSVSVTPTTLPPSSVTPTTLPPSSVTPTTSPPSTVTPTTSPPSTVAPSSSVAPSTLGVPMPTVGSTGEPTLSYPTVLPSVIFPTVVTIPLPSSVPAPTVATTAPTTASTAPPAPATTSAPVQGTTTPTATNPSSTAPTSTAPTSTAPEPAPTSAPTTTTPGATAPPLSAGRVPTLIYPASGQFHDDTDFAVTVANNSSRDLWPVLTISIPDGVELAADLPHPSCRTAVTSVVCRFRARDYWYPVPAHGSVTYDIYLHSPDGSGAVESMPTASVAVDRHR